MYDYARLVRAILTEDIANLRRLIRSTAEANLFDDTGRTPLHIAVMHARSSVLAPLMDAGADPAVVSGDGMSASDMAKDHGGLLLKSFRQAQRNRASASAGLAERQLSTTGGRMRIKVRHLGED